MSDTLTPADAPSDSSAPPVLPMDDRLAAAMGVLPVVAPDEATLADLYREAVITRQLFTALTLQVNDLTDLAEGFMSGGGGGIIGNIMAAFGPR